MIDIFSNCISFYKTNYSLDKSKANYCKKLHKIILESLLDFKAVIIIINASIKNNVTSSIFHIHSFSSLLKKTLYHTVNIILVEIELFTIRYKINQTIQMQDVSYIIVIIDFIHTVEKIFDPSMHLHQH